MTTDEQAPAPEPKVYTYRDPSDGHVVKFKWNAAAPPTDTDLDEIFRASRAQASKAIDYSGAVNDAIGAVGRAGGMGVPGGPIGEAAARFAGNPKNWPSIAAGLAATLTGGASLPASTAIAGLSSGAGSIAKNAADYFLGVKPNMTATDAAKDVAFDAGTQAALTGGLGLLGQGAKLAGRKAYGWLGLSPAKALAEEFGRDTMAQAGIDLGAIPGTERAVQQATAARTASAAKVNDMLTAANPTAAPIRSAEIVPPALKPAYDELRARASTGKDIASDLTAVAERSRGITNSLTAGTPGQPALPGGGVDMLTGQARKQAAQAAATAAYKRQLAGQPVNDLEALIDKNLATAYKDALETRAPGLDAANAKTQTLIGLTKALSDAQNRPVVLRAMAALPTHGTSLLTLPPVAGAAGIGLDRLGGMLGAPVTPAMVRAAIVGMLGNDQTPAETTPNQLR